MDSRGRLRAAQVRVSHLEQELAVARRELSALERESSLPAPKPGDRPGAAAQVSAGSSPAEKLALFRARFAGRDDVYAHPWVSRRTGKKGWSPAVRGGFYTDAITDADFLPLTDAVIEQHLRGGSSESHVGLYPMRLDDTCKLLVCDFDDGQWREDAAAFVAACEHAGIDTISEISRSGEGAHVWIFFEEAVPAASARAMGASLLRTAMASRATMSMSSYDRFFPSQDTLPQRASGRMRLGNLIALPLQGDWRRNGTTIFADPSDWRLYEDQFAALARVVPVAYERLEEFAVTSSRLPAGPRESLSPRPRRAALRAVGRGRTGQKIVIRRDAMVHIATADVPAVVVTELKHAASVSNPEFYRRQAQRFSTFGVPRLVTCFEHDEDELRVPRGLEDEVISVLGDAGYKTTLRVEVEASDVIDVTFTGELRIEQRDAVEALLQHDIGVLVAPPGSGKTVIACALIAERATPTAILVNRAELLQQWRTRLTQFLSITDKQLGQLGGGRRKRRGIVDLIMMQSIAHRAGDPSILEEYGQIIVDECHAVAAPAVEAAIRAVNARTWVGLTATPYRADHMDGLITMQCGPIRHTIDVGPVVSRGLVVHETEFTTDELGTDGPSMQAIYTELAADGKRNALTLREVVRASAERRRSLVLTNRLEHVEILARELTAQTTVPVLRFHGRLRPAERRALRERLATLADAGDAFALIAIDKVAGEGIDLPALDTLFLTMPVSYKGRVIQQLGRVTRGHQGTDAAAVVHDFHDAAVPWLDRMHRRRKRVMAKEGFAIGEVGEFTAR